MAEERSFRHLIVTGGAGFIGSNFIRYMLERYPALRITNLDKLTYAGNLENLKEIEGDERYRFVKGDVCSVEDVERCFEAETDGVVNFAAETHVDRSIGDPESFVRTDVLGAHVLLEACRSHGNCLLLQISTDEVYGSIDKGSFREGDPLEPNSPYSASKAGGELLVRSYAVTFDLPVLITRASNNYGPFQYPEKLIPLFVTNALEDRPLPLYGDGLNVRDWLYVEDHCSGVDLVLRRGSLGEVYNIGGGTELPNIEITRRILALLDKGEELIRPVKDRPGHDRRYSLDCRRLRQLGWEPAHSFEEALARTVRWYQENPDWWRALKSKREEFLAFYRENYGLDA